MKHVLHHSNCPDGVVGYLIVAEALGWECRRHAMSYGDDLPELIGAGDDVVIVDFCPPVTQLEQLTEKIEHGGGSITLLDHHATAQGIISEWLSEDVSESVGEAIERNGKFSYARHGRGPALKVLLDMNRSGAGIAWDFFHPGEPRPTLVDYVEDKDLWLHDLPGSRQIGTLLNVLPKREDLSEWSNLMEVSDPSDLFERARVPWLMHETAMAEAVKRHWWVTPPDREPLPITMVEYMYGSSAAEVVAESADVPLAMYVTPSMPGGPIRCGVRGEGARELAESFGGGGHDRAAGFALPSWDGWTHAEAGR